MDNCQKFKVDGLVKIRQWGDMEKEFGVDSVGDITTQQMWYKRCEYGKHKDWKVLR